MLAKVGEKSPARLDKDFDGRKSVLIGIQFTTTRFGTLMSIYTYYFTQNVSYFFLFYAHVYENEKSLYWN